jgi:hypothetical protein
MTDNVNSYNGLILAIQQWTNRNDSVFLQNIPLFISLAEQQFFIDCSTLGNEVYLTGVFNANNGIVAKPASWGQTLTFSYLTSENNVVVLERVPYEYIRTFVPNNNTVTPECSTYISNNTLILPQYYTDYGYDNFLISPTPQTAFTYEIAYFQKIQPLTVTNQTNWITQYAYDAFFYLCLDKAFRFIEDTPMADMYLQKGQERMQALIQYNQGRIFDRTAEATKG